MNYIDMLSNLAREATPGPWMYYHHPRYNEHHVSLPVAGTGFLRPLFDEGCRTEHPDADAAYIAAANPTTMLDLVMQYRAMESTLTEIAAYDEGEAVGPNFDEPKADTAARQVLDKL